MSALLLRDDAYRKSCDAQVVAVQDGALELDRTVFYPAGGSQHAVLDWEARHRHMRLHTALHLLCAVVKAPVTGGRIGEDKASIEADLNTLVRAATPTGTRWVSDAELEASPDLVRTMSVAPPRGEGRVRLLDIPGMDLQACGGTHVANTAEIGPLRVARIRSEGKHNKRVTLELTQQDTPRAAPPVGRRGPSVHRPMAAGTISSFALFYGTYDGRERSSEG